MTAQTRLAALSNADLARALATARNRRDAYAIGREPEAVRTAVRELVREQARRRTARSGELAAAAAVANVVNRAR